MGTKHTCFPGNRIHLLLTAWALGPLTSSWTISLELSFPFFLQPHILSYPHLPRSTAWFFHTQSNHTWKPATTFTTRQTERPGHSCESGPGISIFNNGMVCWPCGGKPKWNQRAVKSLPRSGISILSAKTTNLQLQAEMWIQQISLYN